ncbi:MAG: fibronectin type III domain-containing protein, partial [Anaerovoracaceae bacterium]
GKIGWGKTSVSKTAAKITWKAAANAQRYVVYKMNTKGDFVKKTIVKGTEYRDSSLKSGKTYKYKVAAYSNASGAKVWGEMSAVKTVKTK